MYRVYGVVWDAHAGAEGSVEGSPVQRELQTTGVAVQPRAAAREAAGEVDDDLPVHRSEPQQLRLRGRLTAAHAGAQRRAARGAAQAAVSIAWCAGRPQ
jgi:hypothetical protein